MDTTGCMSVSGFFMVAIAVIGYRRDDRTVALVLFATGVALIVGERIIQVVK